LNVPSFSVLWQQNKVVCKKHLPDLALFCTMALVLWLIEILYQQSFGLPLRVTLIPMLRGLPLHYLPELVAFFFFGRLAADLKTLVPTSLAVSVTYLLSVVLLLALFGFSGFWLLFSVLFMAPFPFGYLIQKVSNRLKRSQLT
jgi:hypothetical protein